MIECKAAVCEFEELHEMAKAIAAKYSFIRMGAAFVLNEGICFHFKPGEFEAERQAFFELIKPLDEAGFWERLPDADKTGWIGLTEDMTRKLIDREGGLGFKVEKILFLYSGVVLLEKNPGL